MSTKTTAARWSSVLSQLVEMRKMEKNRLEQTHASQKTSLLALEDFDELIEALNKDIDRFNDSCFNGKDKIISKAKGVASTTCVTLLSMLSMLPSWARYRTSASRFW